MHSTLNFVFSPSGSLVPFSLRVIHAELPQHNGRPQETLDRLYRLLSTIRSVLKNLLQGLSEFGETIDLKEDIKFGNDHFTHPIELYSHN